MTRLTTTEAAAYLRCAPGTLKNLRIAGGGPIYSQPIPNGRVTYSQADLDAWLERGRKTSTSDIRRPRGRPRKVA